jgi:predicted phosphodiesterase
MARIAVLADIHGNLPALEAALDDLDDQQVDEVLVGGDLVGRGPQGSAVVDRIRDRGWPCVQGNHEEYLINFRRRDVPDAWLEADVWAASRWMADELEDDDLRYIDDLPFSISSEIEPTLRLVHGSPRSNSEGIGPWTSDEDCRIHLDAIEGRYLGCAHTHRPLVREFDEGTIVNVGSVGLPFNGDPRAQYTIFEPAEDRRWSVEMRRVDYDRDHFLDIYEASGFLECGGLTAKLLRLEVIHARPYLVPFSRWTRYRGDPFLEWEDDEDAAHHRALFEDFLEFYDPNLSMAEFHQLLERDDAEDYISQ